MTERILEPLGAESHSGTLVVGDTLTSFLERVVREDARGAIRESATRVLGNSLSHGPDSTGLVVGRVQSGKTLSYEAVISLARDNDFSLVIVISGISNPLLAQGEKRLREDLTKADPDGWKLIVPNDKQQSPDLIKQDLSNVQANWSNPETPRAYRQTALVVLLKHHSGILGLARMLKDLDFSNQRVLIIDDEADQASLNTLQSKGKKSSTFKNLLALRDALPGHRYLQYTATPQAPLLIAIDDALAPNFVCVLEPGTGYTGGEFYFESTNSLVKTIPASDLAAADQPNGPPPASLRKAMQEFLAGAAQVVVTGEPRTRSMLVHPSRQTNAHADFYRWIKSMALDWQDKWQNRSLVTPTKLKEEFHQAWQELAETYPKLSSFEECWNALGIVFQNLKIIEVNTSKGPTPVIDWSSTQSYILVGGQAIDRGFTVEGLTVTYMPRGPGTRNADTVQQRARFFGYKASYAGLCRVYLEADVRSDFEMYVEHERHMLNSLKEIEAGTESLKQWKREFYLDSRMKATRASVISIPVLHVKSRDRWVRDREPIRQDRIPLANAQTTAGVLLRNVQWERTRFGHDVGYITFSTAIELLVRTSPDSLLSEPEFQALSLNLARLRDDNPDSKVVRILRMRPDSSPSERQVLSGNPNAIQPFQGRNSSGYGGDINEYDPEAPLTVQLHEIEAVSRGDKAALAKFLLTAWRIPENSNVGWIIQTGD